MKIKANAKINLALDVTGKRDDGYHEVCMILQEIDLCDELDIELTHDGQIHLECDENVTRDKKDNIAYKSAKAFFEKSASFDGCRIKLSKNIPVMAGLGGGSSDASAVLKALNSLTGFKFSNEELREMALTLGADVPFFIEGKTSLAQGIGEKLSPISYTPDLYAVLIKPCIDVSTKKAYEIIDSVSFPHPDVKKASEILEDKDLDTFFTECGNVFEHTLGENTDIVEKIKSYLLSKGALFSMMSGSGPTVFGLFDKKEDAENAGSSFDGECMFKGVTRFIG